MTAADTASRAAFVNAQIERIRNAINLPAPGIPQIWAELGTAQRHAILTLAGIQRPSADWHRLTAWEQGAVTATLQKFARLAAVVTEAAAAMRQGVAA